MLAALAVGLLVLNLLASMMSIRGAAPASIGLVGQAVTGALAACHVPNVRDARTRGFAAHLAIWVTLAGAPGVAIWIALVAADFLRREPTVLFADAIDAEIDEDPVEALAAIAGSIEDRRVRIEGASVVQPLRDILTDAPTFVQLRALAALAQSYDPSMADALSLALTSREASVRVLAATALAKLHQQYGARIDACAVPDHAAAPPTLLALGEARLAFALSGLLSAERRAATLEQAEAAFAAALAIDWSLEPAAIGHRTSRRANLQRPPAATSPRPPFHSAHTPTRPLQ